MSSPRTSSPSSRLPEAQIARCAASRACSETWLRRAEKSVRRVLALREVREESHGGVAVRSLLGVGEDRGDRGGREIVLRDRDGLASSLRDIPQPLVDRARRLRRRRRRRVVARDDLEQGEHGPLDALAGHGVHVEDRARPILAPLVDREVENATTEHGHRYVVRVHALARQDRERASDAADEVPLVERVEDEESLEQEGHCGERSIAAEPVELGRELGAARRIGDVEESERALEAVAARGRLVRRARLHVQGERREERVFLRRTALAVRGLGEREAQQPAVAGRDDEALAVGRECQL